MSFFDKINNYLMVNATKEILKGRDPEELLPDSVLVGTWQKYVINSEWKTAKLTWLVTYRDGIPARRRSPVQVLTGPDLR